MYAQVCREDVDGYTPRKVLVPCKVRVQWIKEGNNNPKPLSHEIKLLGAKKGFDFLTVTSPSLCIGMCCIGMCIFNSVEPKSIPLHSDSALQSPVRSLPSKCYIHIMQKCYSVTSFGVIHYHGPPSLFYIIIMALLQHFHVGAIIHVCVMLFIFMMY